MEYRYQDPLEKGYQRVKVKKNILVELRFIQKGHKFFTDFEIYFNKDTHHFYIQYLTPLWVRVVETLLYPLKLVIYGLKNFKSLNNSIYRLWNEKETGSFSSTKVFRDNAKSRNSYMQLLYEAGLSGIPPG